MSQKAAGKVGVAFSGGGIRSASFCSGVLRRLLQKEVAIDYLSCVSGGGYIGASYLDWKYRNEHRDDPEWHKKYFEHLRQHSNPVCDCNNPCRGCLEALRMICVVILVVVVLPLASLFMFGIITAYVIDFFFGEVLRAPFTCPRGKNHNFTASQINENPEITIAFNMTKTVECVPFIGPLMLETVSLFGVLLLIFLGLYFVKTLVRGRRVLFNFFRVCFWLSGFIFAMVFLPWVIEQYIVVTPLWLNALILILSIFIWLGFPLLRDSASLMLVVYFCAYAVKWRVYKTVILGFQYTQRRFLIMLWVSGLLLWLHPFLGALQKNAVHMYIAWTYLKTFFSPETVRSTPMFPCGDYIPWATHCCESKQENLNRPLTLGDLVDMRPEYKCNVTVNNWRKSNAVEEKNYELLVMSPSIIERIDRRPDEKQFDQQGFVQPGDIKLHSAMATSAAVLSYDLGNYGEGVKSVRDLQIILGIGMGKGLVSQPGLSRDMPCIIRAIPMMVQLLVAIPLLGIPVARYYGAPEYMDKVAILIVLGIFVILTLVAMVPTGSANPGCMRRFVRWCVINIYHVRALRRLMGLINVGPTPPPVLELSDGGHIENLALLPLFKLRLPRIVVVNGGEVDPGDTYATDLITALQQARDKLRCSFIGLSGRDVIEEIRSVFVEKPEGEQPRHYRFLVEYYEKSGLAEKKVGDGEVLLLSPRHPRKGVQSKERSWRDFDEIEVDEKDWYRSPVLNEPEVNRLTGCCFECCHLKICEVVCRNLCGRFPFHSTGNQMFTSSMFTAYHNEGYRACAEAQADKFLSGESTGIP